MSLLDNQTRVSEGVYFPALSGGGGGSVPANLSVSTLTVAGDNTGKNIVCQNILTPAQGLKISGTANSTMTLGYADGGAAYQTYIDTGSMMPYNSGLPRWQTRFQNPVEILPGNTGAYEFTNSNLTVLNAGISVPALTNISSINGVAYTGGGGGGPTSTRLPLSAACATGTFVVPANGSVKIIDNFSIVGGHTYTITWGILEEQGSIGNWQAFFGIDSFANYTMSICKPSTQGAPITFSFRATANASDAYIAINNSNGATNINMFITQEPNVGVCVLTDLGVI